MGSHERQRNNAHGPSARREMLKGAFFRPTAGGYLYRAPTPYVFRRTRHYIVTDTQRDAILDVLVPPRNAPIARLGRALQFGIFGLVGLSLSASLSGLYATRLPGTATIVLGALMLPLLIAVLVAIHRVARLQLSQLQPILAAAQPTAERITNADVLWSFRTSGDGKAQRRRWIIGMVANALVSAAFLGAAVVSWPKHGSAFSYAQPVFLATMAILLLVKAAIPLHRSATQSSGDGARALDQSLRRITYGATALFLAFTLGHLALGASGYLQPDYAGMLERAEIAAANGDAAAMARLGWLYREGKGVAQSYTKAQEWYERSANAGNADAMVSLGVLCENGLGGPRDYVKALAWFHKAAAAGNTSAMDWIGWNYQIGHGVTKDLVTARQWFAKAAAGGNRSAQHNLAMTYYNGWGVAQDHFEAREWLMKAASSGLGISMDQLGIMSLNGFGTPKDAAAARAWYEKAVSARSLSGMQHLAAMLDQGTGGPADHTRAAQLLLESARRGHNWSQVVMRGPLAFLTPETRRALKHELARLGHYSGTIDDRWDDAARAGYGEYLRDRA